MDAQDLDPNFLLPLWRALVAYFSGYRPLIHDAQRLQPAGRHRSHS